MITGLVFGIMVAFVIGLFARVRFQPGRSRHAQTGVLMAVSAAAALIVGHLFGERGWGLVLFAALWAVTMAAPFAGNLVRERFARRQRTPHLF